MERGVVVGGLMICGSFLLAASLNRSAVKETPPAEPAVASAPITPPTTPPLTAPTPAVRADNSKPASCAADTSPPGEPVTTDAPSQGDLPGNGREACSQ